MKWSMFLILTVALSLICCASCGTNPSNTGNDQPLLKPGPDKIVIHFNRLTHKIERVIVAGEDQAKKCPAGPPTSNLAEAQVAAKQCFQNDHPDFTEAEPVLKIDTFKVNPTWCVIYDPYGNRYFVQCGN